MQQMVGCPSCGSQNTAGLQFCTNCGIMLPGGGQQQVLESWPTPGALSVAADVEPLQKYIFLEAAAIIFKIIGWVVLVGGVIGSIAVAVLMVQGAMAELANLLNRGMEIIGVSGFDGAGVAAMAFWGVVGSMLCGLGFLAFAELFSAVIEIEKSTRSKD